ncbi:MAG: type II toxin-antitoxin system Phd/YefM family antitoxin [Mesorhizobium sp.]|uniref:type II toxin-antitoxin system Phd/YefM family antitoxin n=1 Tax=Mesorhizobium sp. TaxID=1871066 RepID=UPI000FE9D272|nr:type II toxin-antitoxin system Phd/YefM family antitoxin [Mesorhizobium sp.]RWJ39752.1 MAG: type II toxin-antitoxin system Phd/YefM family antitoxin [Mesorhizobium sp.]RWJ81394.1 MAG: type II toxin-antitoxin system Phd/YefM family antitoxin [Mesorhizobium sp.]TIR08905.1 MAG: type II toxin-antitoxin system Phd/YefM family antitoxin [Mesorhizobium sp.]
MKTMSAKDAKNAFGVLIDTARAEPVAIEKHGRKVVVVLAIEEYERLLGLEDDEAGGARRREQNAER